MLAPASSPVSKSRTAVIKIRDALSPKCWLKPASSVARIAARSLEPISS